MSKTQIRVGLIGYGRAGKAVSEVLRQDNDIELAWIFKSNPIQANGDETLKVFNSTQHHFDEIIANNPVDAVIDFSSENSLPYYIKHVRNDGLMLVSAISDYSEQYSSALRDLSEFAPVLQSPNITLGINFVLLASKLLRKIAPFADVAIVEQHFRDKPEVSGTAKVLAENLELDEQSITSLRVGGIVGYHEVIFGFPHQTVRLSHDSIRREAFGTGAVYALKMLSKQKPGYYKFDELLELNIRELINQS